MNFLLDDFEETIECADPETIAIVFMEPVQTSGGAITPPAGYYEGIRKICDRHGILICSDEVINAFGRLGEWFAAPRYGLKPDIITCAKGISSAYSVVGGVLVADHVLEQFTKASAPFAHGLTFGGHPLQTAIALKNLEVMERLDVLGNVRRNTTAAARHLRRLSSIYRWSVMCGETAICGRWNWSTTRRISWPLATGPIYASHFGSKLLSGLPRQRPDAAGSTCGQCAQHSDLAAADLERGRFCASIESALRKSLLETFASFKGK